MGFKYIRVYIPSHPSASRTGHVLEHRLVMEKKIGRYLKKDEIIHHIDGDSKNNEIDNLEITSVHNHLKYHLHNSEIRRKAGISISKAKKGKPTLQFDKASRKKGAKTFSKLWKIGKIFRRSFRGKNNPNYKHGASVGLWDRYYRNKQK
ncbi:MAG TPA: HNH endonuclease [Patescibacteria group bacterium]|nr:HNH endonuclease [Patescibacteria group bacterium]